MFTRHNRITIEPRGTPAWVASVHVTRHAISGSSIRTKIITDPQDTLSLLLSIPASSLSLSVLPLSVDEDTGKEREQTQREKKEMRGRVFKGGLLPQKSRISRCIRSELVTRSVWRVRCVAASDSKLQGTETKRRKNTWLHTGDRSCRVNVSSSPILVGNLYGPKFRERENEERGGEI